jgi:hypothetical protein
MDLQETTLTQQRTRPTEPSLRPPALLFGWIEVWLTWLATCRAYYRAAIAYEELYRLPEAELRMRGYTRATLARDVTGFDVTYHGDC